MNIFVHLLCSNKSFEFRYLNGHLFGKKAVPVVFNLLRI